MSNYNYNYTVPNYSVPSNQNSWRNNNIPQGQSQPAAPLHTSRGSTIRETYPVYPVANSTSQYSAEFLNDKVEQLEKEKIHLNFILLQLNEREGRNVKKIEQLEFDLEDCKSKYIRLSSSLEESREQTRASNEQAKILKEGKEELFLAVLNLNERIEMQNKTAQEAQTIWAKLPAAIKALKRLDDEAVKLRREKTSTDAEKEALARSVAQLQETAEETLIEMTKLKSKMDIERNNLNSTTKSLEEATLATVNLRQNVEELKALNLREKTSFHSERNSLLDELERLRNQLATRSSILESMNTPTKDDPEMDFNGKQHFLEFMDDLKHNLLKSEMKRKQLHNALQELRGNIRVFVRTRPFLSMDGDEQFDDNIDPLIGGCIKFYRDTTSVSLVKGPNERDKPQIFSFNHVFKCESTQEEVYKEAADLVQSALDGYKVCIFSYGQTGSGKTHTMTGDFEGKMRGIIPRSVEQIIENVLQMRGNGWDIVVTMSMVEIYNEELNDLLDTSPNQAYSYDSQKVKLKISMLQGFVTIAGLTSVELNTQDLRSGMTQLEGLLDLAARSRMTACTAMNERSSRSHALFMLDIIAKHSDGTTYLKGGLRLVDLAGSERADRTADVFVSLGNKAPHIPYRNSKLTMVLQDCLSGDGKALMFVNISPTHASSQETLCSLRFANQVSQVELGKATRNLHTIQPSTTNNSEKDNKSVILSPRDRITLNQIAASITSLDGRGARKTSFSVKKGAKVPKKSPNRGHRPNSLVPKILIHENKAGDFSETSSESSASNSRNSIAVTAPARL